LRHYVSQDVIDPRSGTTPDKAVRYGYRVLDNAWLRMDEITPVYYAHILNPFIVTGGDAKTNGTMHLHRQVRAQSLGGTVGGSRSGTEGV
jgi:hypothetical protein